MKAGSMFWLGVILLLSLVIAPQLVLPAVGVVMTVGLAGWALYAWLRAGARRGWRR